MDLYDSSRNTHEAGIVLKASDFPHYFEALLKERIIAADDAPTDKYTYEFADVYLKPNGISSMLDAPIRLAGIAIGVFCCEHVGEKRIWEIDEKNFAASVADFVSIAFELAEHKKTADELRRHRNELEHLVQERTSEINEKNKELEAFSYSISHDLRAPLRHISGYLKIIEEDYAGCFDKAGKEYMQTTLNSVAKMNTMIEALLNMSKISTHAVTAQEVDLSQMLRDIADQLITESNKIDMVINETPKTSGDVSLLQMALTNLMDNAIKYTQNVKKPCIEFGARTSEGKQVYYLRDNGCGFDMKYADKLFTAFQRLHGNDEFQGNGIGLSTVQRIIQKHGGEIWAEAEPNKGATFYFNLIVE